MYLLGSYVNGETSVDIFSNGTKVRDISKGKLAEFPESMDVKITNWCDAACFWCHEMSTKNGEHGNLQNTIDLICQLPPGIEIAIGGGHPLSHPDFDDFVKELSSKGIICNVTINEKHFEKELTRIEKLVGEGLIKGVGYSYSQKACEWKYEHLVSHVIIGVTPYQDLTHITKVNNKVLLLGYKRVGRGIIFDSKNRESVEACITSWYRWLFHAAQESHLSFDNLAIDQLNPKRLFANEQDFEKFYMGRDGCYSMYLDAVKQEYAQSSTSQYRLEYLDSIRNMFKNIQPGK